LGLCKTTPTASERHSSSHLLTLTSLSFASQSHRQPEPAHHRAHFHLRPSHHISPSIGLAPFPQPHYRTARTHCATSNRALVAVGNCCYRRLLHCPLLHRRSCCVIVRPTPTITTYLLVLLLPDVLVAICNFATCSCAHPTHAAPSSSQQLRHSST
jgi:hypothetical protein